MLGVVASLVVTIFAGWVILKNYKPQLILFASGIVLMALTILTGVGKIPGVTKSTGLLWFDIFELIHNTFSSQMATIGLIILVIGAFSFYMEHVGASAALVSIVTNPLKKLNKPYLVLALTYVVGQFLHVVVPSAAGLGLLLMATMFPTLLKLGIHPLTACSVIATTACLDTGPASGMSNIAATTGGIDVTTYFVYYHLKVLPPVIAAIAILHFITQRYFDKRDGLTAGKHNPDASNIDDTIELKAPLYYAVLPLIPLILVLIFNPLVYKPIRLNIITAILLTVFLTVALEMVRTRNIQQAYEGFNYYLKRMSSVMDVVTLMISASVFAAGLKSIGAIDTLIAAGRMAGFGYMGMTVIMTSIIVLAAALTGSGNAAFISFAALAPDIAGGLGFNSLMLLVPMQLAAGIGRSMSPVSGVVIACSGLAEQSPIAVSKRTFIPMLGGFIVLLVTTFTLL